MSAAVAAAAPFRRLLAVQVTVGLAYSTFLILPKYLAVALGADARGIGLVMGAFGVGVVAMAPFVEAAHRRFERRRLLVLSSLLVALASAGFLAVDAAGALAAGLRVLQGVAWAFIFSASSHLAVRMAPDGAVGRAIALSSSANLVTNAIGPAIVEPLLGLAGPAAVFLFASFCATVAAHIARSLPGDGAAAAAAPATAAATGSVERPWFHLFASLVLGLDTGAVFAFYQPLALAAGATHVGSFLVAYTITAIALRVLGGRAMERIGYRRLALGTFVVYGGVVAAMPLLGPGRLALFGALYGAVHGIFYPSLVSSALQAVSVRGRDALFGWMNAAFHIGSLGVVPLGVLARAAGYGPLFVGAGVLTSVTAIGFLRRRSGR